MVFCEICPPLIFSIPNKERVEIAIWFLGPGDQIDDLIGDRFQFRIRLGCQRVSYRFKPLGHITILENFAIKITLGFSAAILKFSKALLRSTPGSSSLSTCLW